MVRTLKSYENYVLGMVPHACNPSIEQVEQENCYELEASLVYTLSSRPARISKFPKYKNETKRVCVYSFNGSQSTTIIGFSHRY